ncbi:MAG: hypothetical protein Q4C49_01980 [Bacillota bacterium]|nr:hypothetical protein [Bacillota bacterium]
MKFTTDTKIKIFSVLLCLIVSISSALYYTNKQEEERSIQQIEKPTLATRTNTSPALSSLDELCRRLKLYPHVYYSSVHYYQETKDYGTYVIPGLKATYTLKNNKPSMCTDMTPQGLCVAGNYILVSAYCHNRNHNSVIYVIDKKNGQFIKEIILQGKPHAGGLAYDPIRKEIWLTSKRKGIPELCVFTMEQLETYNARKDATIKYAYRYSIPTLPNASYLSYHNNAIFVGTFSHEERESKVQVFSLTRTKNVKENAENRYFILEKVIRTNTNVQGIAQDDAYLYFSRSDGPFLNSKLELFNKDISNATNEEALFLYNFPERMEQIYLEGDKMYILFESAAHGYNRVGLNFIDRIIVVNKTVLLSN